MDIFLKLIDNSEADKIMKYFGEIPTGTRHKNATLDQKKQHIKRIFKSKTSKMIKKRMKGGGEPFYTYICLYKVPEKMPENNFLQALTFLNEVKKEVPKHIRFAILFLNYPDEVKRRFDVIEENIKNNLDPLDFKDNFDSSEQLKDFLRNSRSFIGERSAINIVEMIDKFWSEDERSKINKCKIEIQDYSILEYYERKNNFFEEYNLNMSNAAYILTHPNEDEDILMLLAVELLYGLVDSKSHTSNENSDDKDWISREELTNTERKYKRKLNELESKVIYLNAELLKYKKSLTTIEKEKTHLNKINIRLEKESNANMVHLNELVKDHENKIRKKESEYSSSIKKLRETLDLKEEINNYKLNKFIVKENFANYEWGIFCLSDYDLTKEIYPELYIANINNITEVKKILLKESISTIYFFINGITTIQFNNICELIERNKKKYIVLDFDNYKELVDWIGYKKTIERNVILK